VNPARIAADRHFEFIGERDRRHPRACLGTVVRRAALKSPGGQAENLNAMEGQRHTIQIDLDCREGQQVAGAMETPQFGDRERDGDGAAHGVLPLRRARSARASVPQRSTAARHRNRATSRFWRLGAGMLGRVGRLEVGSRDNWNRCRSGALLAGKVVWCGSRAIEPARTGSRDLLL
jgi:hypothetical protein